MTAESSSGSHDLDPAIIEWLGKIADGGTLSIARRAGGASRAGYAVDARRHDGTNAELWLRTDPGFGPQSDTLYSLRREAAVYRALADTPVQIARLVAVHPELPAFVMQRMAGDSRFARIADREVQVSIAMQFMEQLATLHRLEPSKLELPELGAPGPLSNHVREEIGEWERQYDAAGGGVPVISLAGAWLRANVPGDAGWPLVLVQGDTGPGNFMFDGDRLVVITDWELAHWGDPHDDLAWVLVRDTLERLPELDACFARYEQASGRPIDPGRLRYFRVLAQFRATIGTLAGLRTRDGRGEIAWQLIYNTLHTRLLAEALAEAAGVSAEPPVDVGSDEGDRSWLYDVALADLRDVVLPALADDFAATRAKGIARLVKHLREVDRLGPDLEAREREELGTLLDRRIDEIGPARRALCTAIAAGALAPDRALPYCLRQAARDTALMRPALGRLADHHLRFIRTSPEPGGTS